MLHGRADNDLFVLLQVDDGLLLLSISKMSSLSITVSRALSYTLAHGVSRSSDYAATILGFFLMQYFGQPALGQAMGEAAVALARRNTSPGDRALTEMATAIMIQHWTQPLRSEMAFSFSL